MTTIIKILNILTIIFTFCVVLFVISSCHQYSQTTKTDNNSKFGRDTIYNPPYLPGAEKVVYGSGTAAKVGVSGPLYLKKPMKKKEMDSLSREFAEWQERIGGERYFKNDSLQKNDTITDDF